MILVEVFIGIGLAVFALILGRIVGHPPLETFRWSVWSALWGVVATVPLILLSFAALRWPFGVFAAFNGFCNSEVIPRLEKSSWSELALISLAVSVGDEMLCRGVLQAWFSGHLGVPGGLALASILFAFIQPISIQFMMMSAMLGLYLGSVWILSGNLLTVMVANGLNEFVVLAYLVRIRPHHSA